MKSATVKYFLAGIFVLLLWAPQIQDKLQIFKGGELRGAFYPPDNISFSFGDWFNGKYANKKEEYLRAFFGFHGDLVRIYNQVNYSLFKITDIKEVILGKDDYLYQEHYIDAYNGKDFVGYKEVNKKAIALKQLQDTLQKRGIFLFVAFAPGKAAFCPEYIPDRYRQTEKKPTNYEAYVEACKKQGLNYIDLTSYLLSMKDTSRYRLYPRRATHWSYYGDFLAFDSIIHYLQQKSGFKMAGLRIDSIQLDTHPRWRDNDIGSTLNLIAEFNKDTLAYPFFSATDTNRTLNLLAIGDSYYDNMQSYNSPLIFKNSWFWFYYVNIQRSGLPKIEDKEAHTRLKEIILRQNIICIIQTDGGLRDFGYTFIDQANEVFKLQK